MPIDHTWVGHINYAGIVSTAAARCIGNGRHDIDVTLLQSCSLVPKLPNLFNALESALKKIGDPGDEATRLHRMLQAVRY